MWLKTALYHNRNRQVLPTIMQSRTTHGNVHQPPTFDTQHLPHTRALLVNANFAKLKPTTRSA